MAYATAEELIEVLSEQDQIELTDDNEGDAVVDEIITAALNRTSSYIDSYLVRRYTLPLETTPESIKDACLIITKRKLFGRRDLRSMEGLESEYRETIAWLRAIAAGEVEIPELVEAAGEVDAAIGFAGGSEFEDQIW